MQQTVTIESIDNNANGIARIEGKTVFVSGALPGEAVSIEIYKQKPSFDLARVAEIITPSPDRVIPECPNFGVCGGCSLQHLDPLAQVSSKEKTLFDNFRHISKIDTPPAVLPPLHADAWHYRHRARLSVRYVAKKDSVLIGFRERGSAFVADMRECRILPQQISDLIPKLRVLVMQLSIRDKIPQIEVAAGEDVSILLFRVMQPMTAADEELLRKFVDDNQSAVSQLQIWLQPAGLDSVYPFYPDVAERKSLYYTLPQFNLTMPFAPTEFTQVNPKLNQQMVALAIQLLDLHENDRVLDFFCGIGNFSLAIATQCASVLGVEGSEALVKRARENAASNNLAHKTQFTCMDLFTINADKLTNLVHTLSGRLALHIMSSKWLIDPPRDGAFELIKAITPENMPQRIVYVSCNPATLARDAEFLVHTLGYSLTHAGVMNMFPHTSHVESIAVFIHGNSCEN